MRDGAFCMQMLAFAVLPSGALSCIIAVCLIKVFNLIFAVYAGALLALPVIGEKGPPGGAAVVEQELLR
jgi:hypothetical protein